MSVELVAINQSDVDLAKSWKDKLRPLLTEVCTLMNSASQGGLVLNFQIGRDQFGRAFVQDISVVRPL